MLQKNYGKNIQDASNEEIYTALLEITKEKMAGMKRNEGSKKLYYISAEFLIGNSCPTISSIWDYLTRQEKF